MNDFTKNELEWLYEGMESMMNADSCEPERILLKVRSMINSYCEHENKCVNGAELACEDCERVWK